MGQITTTEFIQAQVTQILATQALRAPETIAAETALETLGLDSLSMAEVIFALEETFDIAVPFNANTPDRTGVDLSTVASIVAEVERLLLTRRG
jgi:acyl carrier protein